MTLRNGLMHVVCKNSVLPSIVTLMSHATIRYFHQVIYIDTNEGDEWMSWFHWHSWRWQLKKKAQVMRFKQCQTKGKETENDFNLDWGDNMYWNESSLAIQSFDMCHYDWVEVWTIKLRSNTIFSIISIASNHQLKSIIFNWLREIAWSNIFFLSFETQNSESVSDRPHIDIQVSIICVRRIFEKLGEMENELRRLKRIEWQSISTSNLRMAFELTYQNW